MDKKKILFCGESTYLGTGFATYGKAILSRLFSTGRFELAELGCYGTVGDPRENLIPWKYYPNQWVEGENADEYNRNPTNQFGEWRFEQACLDFKPDIVADFRDWWMYEHQGRSPFRPYFHWSIMPTVDSEPQDEQWIASCMDADSVLAYSDYGLSLLKKQSNNLINTIGVASPAADFDVFKPVEDRDKVRVQCGLSPEVLIVGSVMRNQKRKLFPDLLQAFAKFIKTAPTELSDKTFLYLHTTYPDVGWDFPRILKEEGISRKVLFTYHCKRCRAIYPSLFMDARTICRSCHGPYACLPSSAEPIPDKALSLLVNLMDVYVQYATCEGFGMPQVEAAACGVPIMSVDYSAMSDIVKAVAGTPIKVAKLARESETQCYRAIPDDDDLIRSLKEILSLSREDRRALGLNSRNLAQHHYSYDKSAKVWFDNFEKIATIPRNLTWYGPSRVHQPRLEEPKGMGNEQFVRWALLSVAGRPDLVNSYTALRMVRDLNNEARSDEGMGGFYINEASFLGQRNKFKVFHREHLIEECLKLAERKNKWEKNRLLAIKNETNNNSNRS